MAELRRRARACFGEDLQQISPERVQGFFDEIQLLHGAPGRAPVSLAEPASDYRQVMLNFFNQALDEPSEPTAVALWLTAFELWAAAYFESQAA